MKVVIYVEGPSDKAAMGALLGPLIARKLAEGVEIAFFEAPEGDRKVSVLTKVPKKAANILLNSRETIVVALPDLYPRNKGFSHETVIELIEGCTRQFTDALRAKGVKSSNTVAARFRVFCFKHDLESLVLAAEKPLASRLGINKLTRTWRIPVEDQNHDRPPKVVVGELFAQHRSRYVETVDAPLILSGVTYEEIAANCQQCFQPFVRFLEELVPSF